MTTTRDPGAAVGLFNDAINRRDLERLASLITDDHVFIDSAGAETRGRSAVLAAWRGFFQAFPDYRNVFERQAVAGDTVIVEGRSTCSHAPLAGRALWSARIADGKLAEWRVYEDLPEVRAQLGIAARG